MALSLYWASAFILPKKVTNEIEKRLRTFFVERDINQWICQGAIEPRYGLHGSTRVDYEILPSGRLASMEDHGDGGNSSIYGSSSDLWWIIK
ncbi:UNVERIFIED_CONTAM: hypothetical protein Sindi_3050000 [Sesamum indicum]